MAKKKRFCEGCWVKSKTFMSAVLHIDDRDLCLPCVRAEDLNVVEGEVIPFDEIAQVDPGIVSDRAARSKHQPGPKSSKESEMPRSNRPPTLCSCGKTLKARAIALGKCKECRVGVVVPVTKAKAGRPRKVKNGAGKPEPSSANTFEPRVTMSVSKQFLENAWAKLSSDLKAVAIAAALEA